MRIILKRSSRKIFLRITKALQTAVLIMKTQSDIFRSSTPSQFNQVREQERTNEEPDQSQLSMTYLNLELTKCKAISNQAVIIPKEAVTRYLFTLNRLML